MLIKQRILISLLSTMSLATLLRSAAVQGAPKPGSQQAPAREYRKANHKTISAYIVLLRLRYDLLGKWKATGRWPEDPEARQVLADHSRYWDELLGEGTALFSGGMGGDYWDNAALVVFEAESLEAAQEIVNQDPAVQAYVFQAQVRPFDVHFVSNKYS